MSERNSQIFDDVFRSMEEHIPSIMIPLINEVFGTSYAKDMCCTYGTMQTRKKKDR